MRLGDKDDRQDQNVQIRWQNLIKSSLHTADVGECSPSAEKLELKTQGLYSREELYDMAWQQPMTILSSIIGVSPTLISEACKSHNIPVPPPGYWSKVKAGKHVHHTRLPNRPPGMSKLVQVGRPRNTDEVLSIYDLETCPPPIEELRAQLIGAVGATFRRPTKPLRKHKRRSTIWQLLLMAISTLYPVTAEEQDNGLHGVHIYNQTVFLQVTNLEAPRKANVDIVAHQPKALSLSIYIDFQAQEIWRTWEDTEGTPLEENISEKVVELLLCAEVKQRHAESRRHEWLLAQQAKHRAELDDEKRNKKQSMAKQDAERLSILLAQAKDLEHANMLRQLLANVEKAYPQHFDSQVRIWRDLVTSEIIRLDPLTDRRFLDVLDLPHSGDGQTSQAA